MPRVYKIKSIFVILFVLLSDCIESVGSTSKFKAPYVVVYLINEFFISRSSDHYFFVKWLTNE